MTMETSLKTVLRGFFIIGGVSGVLVIYKKIDIELAAAIDRGDWGFLFAFMVTSVLVLGCFWIASELSIKTNPNDTIKACDTAIEKNSLDIAAWHNKGIALAMLGKYDEAINAYNKAIEINSRDADVWYNKGAALNALGEYESAIQCFEKAIEINPKFTEAWNDKGT
jgi:tetratricopeptide (TPR) repeat protein